MLSQTWRAKAPLSPLDGVYLALSSCIAKGNNASSYTVQHKCQRPSYLEKMPVCFLLAPRNFLAKTAWKQCCAHHTWQGSQRLEGPMRLGGLRGIGAETSPFIPASCFPITSEHILTCEQLPHRSSRFCQSQTGISVRIFSSYSSSARAVVSISLHDFAVCVLISVCSGYPYHLTSTQAAALLKRGFRVSELACDV